MALSGYVERNDGDNTVKQGEIGQRVEILLSSRMPGRAE